MLYYSDELCQEFKKKEMSSKKPQAEYPEWKENSSILLFSFYRCGVREPVYTITYHVVVPYLFSLNILCLFSFSLDLLLIIVMYKPW